MPTSYGFLFRFGFRVLVPSSSGGDEQILQETISALYGYRPVRDGTDVSLGTFCQSPDRLLRLDR